MTAVYGSLPWVNAPAQSQHLRVPCDRCGVLREVPRGKRSRRLNTGLCRDCFGFVRYDPVGWQ